MSSLLSVLSSQPPGDESTLWLSAIIQELWPYAANILQTTLKTYVEPALSAAIPKGLPAPRFSRIELGDEGFVIECVRVFERVYAHDQVVPVLEADIRYAGTPVIEMCLGNLPSAYAFGLTDAKIRGRVEVLLRPLLDRVPLIGASQIAFINPPIIDYTLTGMAALADSAIIKGTVRRVVEDVLASIVVLPNRVTYKVAPDTEFFKFVAKPLAIFRVAALSGSGFPSTDRHVLRQAIGQSELPDVYLTFRHGAKLLKTDRVDDNAHPVWRNQVFDFVLMTESKSQQLQIEAYDYDVGSDDYLGHQNVLVTDLIKQGASQVELKDSQDDATPTVRIAARWLPVSCNRSDVYKAIMNQRADKIRPKHCSFLLLSIEIDEAHNLPAGYRPFVRTRFGSHIENTTAAYDMRGVFSVEHPSYEQAFHIPLEGPVDASMRITYQVLDLFSGKVLGHAYSSMSDPINAGPAGKEYSFALLDAENPNASLRVRVRLAAILDSPPLWEVLTRPQNVYQTDVINSST